MYSQIVKIEWISEEVRHRTERLLPNSESEERWRGPKKGAITSHVSL